MPACTLVCINFCYKLWLGAELALHEIAVIVWHLGVYIWKCWVIPK